MNPNYTILALLFIIGWLFVTVMKLINDNTGLKKILKDQILAPPDCDNQIFNEGAVVAIITGGSTHIIELIIKTANENTSEKMDWHFIAGRAVVKTLGNQEEARQALNKVMPELGV